MESPATYKALIDDVGKLLPDDDAKVLREGDAQAERLHNGQFRGDGSPYIVHPRRVALLASFAADSSATLDAMLAGLLHDVMEDCNVQADWISVRFGSRVAELVEQLSATASGNESRSDRLSRKRVKWERIAKSSDTLLVTVHLMDVLDNCMAWRMVEPDMPAWEKLPRWMWQTLEYQMPIAEMHLPIIGEMLREEVDYQRERGVEPGSWRDA